MNVLSDFYGALYPIVCAATWSTEIWIPPGGCMLVNALMATVGTIGVAFYLRFLVALCKECKGSLVGYWARLRDHSEQPAAELTRIHQVTRAA